MHSPRKIANLITEDPDIPNKIHRWSHVEQLEEEEYLDPTMLGDKMYHIKYTIGANFNKPEPMVRYYTDGSGYPGSPGSVEWDILSIDEITSTDQYGNDTLETITPELAEKITQSLLSNLDEAEMQERLNFDDGDDYDYDGYDG